MSRTLTRAPDPHAAPPLAIATRRDLFGTMGAMLLLTAAEAGPAKAAELDGELLSLCNEAVALHTEQMTANDAISAAGLKLSDPEGNAAWEAIWARTPHWHDLCDQIADIPARTPEGLRGKAIVLRRVVALEDPLVASLCRDLLGRSGA